MFTLPIDMRHRWLSPKKGDSWCRVRIGVHATMGTMCLITELPDNPGASVTEGIEYLIQSLVDTFEWVLDRTRTMWLEHYPACPAYDHDRFERVSWDVSNQIVWEFLAAPLAVDLLRQFGVPATLPLNIAPSCPMGFQGPHACICPKKKRAVVAKHERRLEEYFQTGMP